MSASAYASAMKMPALHHVVRVRRFAAWRVPTKASGEEDAPPKLAARPPPRPAWSRTAAPKTTLSITRRVRRKVYIASDVFGE
ncbi:MAG TPA: hypothetical protein VEI06_00210 [Gemmatimonadaceae bacterium]|nr:hypothetical protein [Gemmatimonadaceae bacterium]